jgi:dihydrofolate reductase
MNAIVAVDENWGIGKENRLLFNLSGDMKHFRALTTGGIILLGRKTLETFPGGRPLPNRRNIVLTARGADIPGAEVVHTVQELRESVADEDPEQVFVVGGGSVYTALLPYCKRVYLTKVDTAAEDPDTFFPNLDKLPSWTVERIGEPLTENGVTYRFLEYVNQSL